MNKNDIYKYICKNCDYKTNKTFLYNQHCKSKKHLASMNINHKPEYICQDCSKQFYHKQSLNRHKKQNCIKYTEELKDKDKNIEQLTSVVNTLVDENNQMLCMINDIIPKIGNKTTINNKFNLQVFLNEDCKNALNFKDFLDTLQYEIDIIDNSKKDYLDNISNVFIKNIKQLEINKRPIHCTDLKRDILYIKENNMWEKNNDTILKTAIDNVSNKQFDNIKNWETKNPNWYNTEDGKMKYINMITNITNITNDNKKKIIKDIAKEVIIPK